MEPTWDLASVTPPWGDRPSIYDHVARGGGGDLPDERPGDGPRWVAGGLDGAMGHHFGAGADEERAERVCNALLAVLADASPPALAALYGELAEGHALGYVDPLIQRLVKTPGLDAARFEALAVWLAERAPDREPVKIALALLGLLQGPEHQALLATLGGHEEFTLFAAVALVNTHPDPERVLFELAQRVEGWGRIQTVERLAGTSDPRIRAWMLREGHRNSVMVEYLAHICATTGGLHEALAAEAPDEALLNGAGALLRALIAGGPAPGMDDYEHGALSAERYLHHVEARPGGLEQLVTVGAIRGFVDDGEADWDDRAGRGWTEAKRAQIRWAAERIAALPWWRELVQRELRADDPAAFHTAAEAAGLLGIDPWEHQYERLLAGRDEWYAVVQTDDPERIDRVIALAEARLPLAELAAGPAEELGLGPQWTAHNQLGAVLQGLERFPGRGWVLIRAGLQAPVVRNRHMALRALAGLERVRWPEGAEELVTSLRDGDPDAQVREQAAEVLARGAPEA